MADQSNISQIENVLVLTPADSRRLANLCGQFDANIKSIEGHFDARVSNRGNIFYIEGTERNVRDVESVLRLLYDETERNDRLDSNLVQSVISQLDQNHSSHTSYALKIRKNTIRARSKNQESYLRSIENNTITIGVGPAGTGKTYLAVASAAHALANDSVKRIVLVRPVVEAGERIGFLPGDIEKKVNPYLRPLYDALYEMLGFERVGRLLERSTIELAPLAFMRGRTLNDAFIILDEAQNTTVEQMKMFLTRVGFKSKAVISGDITQIDLPRSTQSGLKHSVRILRDIKDISIINFTNKDIVRHPLVQTIVEAYEKDAKD